jgi:hypothetical protein
MSHHDLAFQLLLFVLLFGTMQYIRYYPAPETSQDQSDAPTAPQPTMTTRTTRATRPAATKAVPAIAAVSEALTVEVPAIATMQANSKPPTTAVGFIPRSCPHSEAVKGGVSPGKGKAKRTLAASQVA